MTSRIRIGALISGSGTNLEAILAACEEGRISGQVVFVGTDNPDAAGLAHARRRRIPTFSVDYRSIIRRYGTEKTRMALPPDADFQAVWDKQGLFTEDAAPEKARAFLWTRIVAEARLLAAMAAHPFDLLILAGFMRTLTPYFIDRVNRPGTRARIMNIHPALLPAFPGTDGYGDTFRYGCKVAGCTVHFIDYGEDSGPIIGQRAFPILPADALERVREKGLRLEWELYAQCVQLFAENRLEAVVQPIAGPRGEAKKRTVIRILPAGASPGS